MRILLHIGTDKTGSTAIQRHLMRNRDWFLSQSVFIPLTGWGVGNGHYALLNVLASSELNKLSQELEAAAAAQFRWALITWEGMSVYDPKEIRRLRTALGNYSVSVLVYLREQADMIQAGFLQELKRNQNRHRMHVLEDPETTIQKLRSFYLLRSWRRNYFRLLKRWQRQFPSAEFMVRVFSQEKMLNGDVVADFLNQLGLASDCAIEDVGLNVNPSLDVETGLLIEAWQSKGLPDEEIAQLVDIALSHIYQFGPLTRYFLSQESVRSIQRYFRRSNIKLARRFMATNEYPFATDKVCWRVDSLASIEARAKKLSLELAEVEIPPTLLGAAQGDCISAKVEMKEGWCTQAKWGVWSRGAVSRIRFRLMRRRIELHGKHIRLVMHGRYYGDNNSTNVLINGIDFGSRKLLRGSEGLLLPVEALLPYEVIDITLSHSNPISPSQFEGANDNREIAFGIQKLAAVPPVL